MSINLKNIPKQPGIYKFHDKNGKIIYIGKSVNLFSRISSYFNGIAKLNFAKQKMVKQIINIETIITNNETESLILETTLIKKHLPKYNILMKDGKNHIYIKITNEEYPQIIKTRFKTDKGIYFGPYTSTYYVSNILKLIKDIFGYGIGEHHFFNTKNSYNLDKYIFKNNLKLENYNTIINSIKELLKGNTSHIKKDLEDKMFKKAKELKFEEAEKWKKYIESLNILEITQIVREGVNGDYKIINIIEKYDKVFLGMIEIFDGKITGFYNYDIKNELNENKEKIIKEFIEKKYVEDKEKKEKITYISPYNIDILSEIKLEVPKIGTKKELLDLCYKNIYEYAAKSHINSLSTKGFSKSTMINLLKILGYKEINKKILFECNDISHISGNHTVASRSIIENGKSNSSKYKKFRIKNLEEQKINDFDSMREIMKRRVKEINKTGFIPDLIIIDGGKGQLSSVVEIIEKNNIDIQVVGIAKKEEELFIINPPPNLPPSQEEGIATKFKKIILDKESNELRLVQKIRDEAHRFAITFNRDSRIKSMKKNILEELPGFGPKTRKKILRKYGNIEKLESVSKEELLKILNKTQIETLENHGII